MGAITNKADDAVWWLGWRPLITASTGAFLGIVLGFTTGSFGLYAAGAGFLLVGFCLLSPWLRRLGALTAVIISAFHVAGSETSQGMLESSGVGTDWIEPLASFIVNIGSLFIPSMEQTTQPVEVIGGGIGGIALWSLSGGVVGALIWLVSVYRINSGYAELYEEFVDDVKRAGEEILGDEGFSRTVSHGVDTIPFVKAAKDYYATNLLIGKSSISLHHGSKLDMVARDEKISDGTKEIFYDQVASVDYDEPYLRIRTSDGEVVRIISSEEPTEMIERVQARLQRYKSASPEDRQEGTVERDTTVGADEGLRDLRETTTTTERESTDTEEVEMEADDEPAQPEPADPAEVGDDGPSDFGDEIVNEVNDILDDFGGSESVEESETVSDIMSGVAEESDSGGDEDVEDEVEDDANEGEEGSDEGGDTEKGKDT